jgi:hypothetical protein
MKVLCLCQKGDSRSVALAWYFKHEHEPRHEALAAGMITTSRQTRSMLYNWADIILLTTPRYRHWIPTEFDSKVREWDVGTDRFFRGFSLELIEMYRKFAEQEILLK